LSRDRFLGTACEFGKKRNVLRSHRPPRRMVNRMHQNDGAENCHLGDRPPCPWSNSASQRSRRVFVGPQCPSIRVKLGRMTARCELWPCRATQEHPLHSSARHTPRWAMCDANVSSVRVPVLRDSVTPTGTPHCMGPALPGDKYSLAGFPRQLFRGFGKTRFPTANGLDS
jgi:hypothetical protein